MSGVRKRLLLSVLLVSAGLGLCASAEAGTEVGIRYGRANLKGDLFPGSGDIGQTPLLGLQVVLDVLPIISLELAGEAYDEDFRFEDGDLGGVVADGTGNFKDTALLATGKVGLPLTLLGPGSIYGGLGLSAHFVDLEIDATESSGLLKNGDKDLEDAVQDIAGESTDVEWHAVLGIRTAIPILPLSAFFELRYQDIMDGNLPDLTSGYLGVNFRIGQ
jgi:hypothetical protein